MEKLKEMLLRANEIINKRSKAIIITLSLLLLVSCSASSSNNDKLNKMNDEIVAVNKQIEAITKDKDKLVKENEQLLNENKELKEKVKSAKPWFEMEESKRKEEEERLKKEKEEAERLKQEEEQRKAEEEKKRKEEEQKKKEEEEKNKYNTGLTWEDIARNESIGTLGKFEGKIIQVMKASGETQYRVAVNDDYKKIMLIAIPNDILHTTLLEDDYIYYTGMSMGNITYTTVLGAEQTIPSFLVDNYSLK